MSEDIKSQGWEPIDFTVYFSFIKWPVLILVVLELFLRSWLNGLDGGLLAENIEVVAWVVRGAVLIWLAWRVIKNFGPSVAISSLAGGITGLILGLTVALYRFSDGVKVWKFFNVITETILVAVILSIALVVLVMLLCLKQPKSKNKLK